MPIASSSSVLSALVAAGVTPGPTVPGAPPGVSGTVTPGSSVPRPETVSPGFAGFVAIFLLACATVLLVRSMTKHLRTVRYTAEQAERAEKITSQGPAQPGTKGSSPT
jgi:hypothetical protein